MVNSLLLDRAGSCYLRLGLVEEAARCYREVGAFRKSGDLFAGLGRHHDAATDYAAAGMDELAGWTLVHFAGDPAAARAHLSAPAAVPHPGREHVGPTPAYAAGRAAPPISDGPGRLGSGPPGKPQQLRRRLVLARCEIAEGAAARVALPVFDAVQAEFARPNALHDLLAEQWAIALADVLNRYDQAALTFAAAVRGRKFGAAQRWAQWSAHVLRTELTLPAGVTATAFPQTTDVPSAASTRPPTV